LCHYTQGVFESHPANKRPRRFLAHHTLKVIPTDAMQVTVYPWKRRGNLRGYRMSEGLPIGPIKWKRITNKDEMETLLLERNKRHLQQMARENTPPTQQYFQKVLSEYGTSDTTSRILDDEISNDLDQFPRVVRVWLQQFIRTKEEQEYCVPVDGFIYPFELQQAFKSVKEKTSSPSSGIHYTFWICMAKDNETSDYLLTMMRLPFVYGFVNDRWSQCLDVMLKKRKVFVKSTSYE